MISLGSKYVIDNRVIKHLSCPGGMVKRNKVYICVENRCICPIEDSKKAMFLDVTNVDLAHISRQEFRKYSKVVPKEVYQKFAIYCAESVLTIFEDQHPNDNRPKEAIEAAKSYLAGKISKEQLNIKRNAAYAVYAAAAYAADAAAADAAAAYAADAAAYAAAAAVYAVYAAVYADAAAVYAAQKSYWTKLINEL